MAAIRTDGHRFSCDELRRVRGQLLEGPFWDDRDGRLLWVDIEEGAVSSLAWPGGAVEHTQYGQLVSAVIPRRRGGQVIASMGGVALADGTELSLLVGLDANRSWMRTNDAKCDPAGRLWIGTMATDARPGAGALYCVSADLAPTRVLDGVTIANGLGWSPDGSRMYYIDSPTKTVAVFDYDGTSGTLANRRVLVDTASLSGLPDGMSVDAQGSIWVAFSGGSAVRRFSADGVLTGVVDVPTPNVTSCAFAGPGLEQLVITTARATDANAPSPGGDLFVCQPDVPGLAVMTFAG